MSIKIENEGKEIEVFTPEEVVARETAAKEAAEKASQLTVAEKDKAIATANAEVERLKKVAMDQTSNFKRLNEMSEAEKAALTAEKLENLKRIEAAEAESKAVKDMYNSDTQKRIENDRETALAKYHGGDEKLKSALEENYKMINLEGTDTATIQRRAKLAADMEKGKNAGANPIYSRMNGSSPTEKKKSEQEEFLKSDKAQEALRRMGELKK